jgi:hypothetical protein
MHLGTCSCGKRYKRPANPRSVGMSIDEAAIVSAARVKVVNLRIAPTSLYRLQIQR